MTDIADEEQCIAITQADTRCQRIVKDGQFCFQHDASNETIEESVSATPQNVVNWLSGELEKQAEKVSGVKRDVYLNLADGQDGIKNLFNDVKQGNIDKSTLFTNFQEITEDVGGSRSKTTTTGALVGGIAGYPGGPIGIWAGIVAGSTAGFWMSEKDARGLLGFLVEDVPDEAEVVPSNHPAILDVDPVQLVIQSTIEDGEDDWIRETNTREWDMDEVEDALQEIPEHTAGSYPPGGYYIRDVETDQIVVLVFGEPEKELSR